MGIDREDALGAVRLSLGRGTTEADIDHAAELLLGAAARLAKPLEDLGDHDATGADVVVALDELGNGLPFRGGITVQEISPGGRINQDPQTF